MEWELLRNILTLIAVSALMAGTLSMTAYSLCRLMIKIRRRRCGLPPRVTTWPIERVRPKHTSILSSPWWGMFFGLWAGFMYALHGFI